MGQNLVGATGVAWIYSLQNTGVALHGMMLYLKDWGLGETSTL